MDRQAPKGPPPATHAQPPTSRLAMGTGRSQKVRVFDPELEEPGARGARTPGLDGDEVAQLAHDLRDPLATIALEMYALDRKLAVGDHSDIRSTSVRIIRNIELLDRLIKDLLDLCCAGDRDLQIARRPTELRALLGQVIERAVSVRDRHRVVLDAPYALTLPIDDLRIERVIANLIANALEHAPRGGPVLVQLEAGSLAARITVGPRGPVEPPAAAAADHEPPSRALHARDLDGHRIALFASKQIVEAHGGRLTVDRVPGAGARFCFELPVPPR